jgi:hypothetical protein
MDLQTAHQNLPESSADVQIQAEIGKNSGLKTQFSLFSTFLNSQDINQKSKKWRPRCINYTSESISNSSGSEKMKVKSVVTDKNGIQ